MTILLIAIEMLLLLLLVFKVEANHREPGDPITESNSTRIITRYFANNIIECTCVCSNNEECMCGKHIDNFDCKLNIINNPSISGILNQCITYNEENNLTEVGDCIYTTNLLLPQKAIVNHTELNDFMCGNYSRGGTLCGKCLDGYRPIAYSYEAKCIACPNGKANWWKYLLIAFLPLTAFYLVVLLFKINITFSHLHGFVFFAQLFTIPGFVRTALKTIRNEPVMMSLYSCLTSLYEIWNLDFLRSYIPSFCLGTDTLQTLSLEFLIGVYPLLLMVASYGLINLYDSNFKPLVVIWKPFGFLRRNWEVKTSLIDAFSTFLLLTNVRIMSASVDLLVPVQVYQLNSTGHLTYSWRLFFDATVPYFGQRHLPYAILAIAAATTSAVLPSLLFILYPFRWFQKFLNLFPVRWYILHTFVDAFQGCYKDGTEPGTCDCRWFASTFLIARLCLIPITVLSKGTMFSVFYSFILINLSILIITVQPFKKHLSHHTYTNVIFILQLAMMCIANIGKQLSMWRREDHHTQLYNALLALAAVLPLFTISIITLCWAYNHRKFMFSGLCARRLGYERI